MSDQILDRIKKGERFPVLAALGNMIRSIDEAANSQNGLGNDKLTTNYQPIKRSVGYNGIDRRQTRTE